MLTHPAAWRTAIAAAALAFAGTASASAGSSIGSLRAGPAFNAVAETTTGVVQTTTISVAGIQSLFEQGTEGNTILSIPLGAGAQVTGIGWNVVVSAFDPSWLSEMVVGFGDSAETFVNLTVGFGEDQPGLNAPFASDGIVDLVELSLNFAVAADGVLRIEFFEDFDDGAVSPDGLWNSGALTIQFTSAVPEPSTYALMALGAAGIFGAAARRRRQA